MVYWQAPEWKTPLLETAETPAEIRISSKGAITITGDAANKALQGLLAGNYAGVSYTAAGGQAVGISLSPVFFSAAHAEFLDCIKGLPPPKLTLKEAGFGPVYFPTDKHSLNADSREMLGRLAEYVNETQQITALIVSGHADSRGSEKYNDRLSGLRSNAVAEFLLSRDFPQQKLILESHGEFSPISTNGTSSGRAMNRRVELNFIYGELPVQKPATKPPPVTDPVTDGAEDEAGTDAPI